MATFFFLAGYELRCISHRYDFSVSNVTVNKQIIVVMACGAITMIVSRLCWANMLKFEIWQVIPYTFTAVLGTIMVYVVSNWLSNSGENFVRQFLLFAGKHTLEILTWHFICFKLISLLIIYVYSLPIERLATFPVISKSDLNDCGAGLIYSYWWMAYSLLGIGIPLSIIWLRKKMIRTQ